MREALRTRIKTMAGVLGVDIQKINADVRLALSQRRFAKLGHPPIEGYDVTRHYGDSDIDQSFRYIAEGFISARIQFIKDVLGGAEIERSAFADIGDPNGVFLKALGKKGTSININEKILGNISDIQTILGALPNIPLPDGSFDYVLCFEVVEHLHDPIGGLKELARLARKGVIISIPCVRRTKIYPYWYDKAQPPTQCHVLECADGDFRKLLTYTNLRAVAMAVHEVFDYPYTPSEALASMVWRALDEDLLCGAHRRFSIYLLQHDTKRSEETMKMIAPKKPLRNIDRIAHPVKSRSGKVTLERNERTVDFPPGILDDLRALVTGFVLRAYPEMDEFYAALSEWSGFPAEQLLATDGADGALHRVFATYVSEGDEVVVLSPSYAMYPVYCQMYGVKMHALTFSDDLKLPFEKVLAAAVPGRRLIALVNPNQPIESCFTLEEMRRLATRCAEHDILLLVDEAYYHFCAITAAPLTREFENVIVARTFSKAFGLAGLRIGYLIAARPAIKALRALKPIYEVNHLNAAFATYFLRRPRIMEEYVASVRAGRETLEKFFGRHGCEVHGKHSNTILARLPEKVSAPALTAALRDEGWLVRAETQAPTTNHLRITIGPPDQMEELCKRLELHVRGERSVG